MQSMAGARAAYNSRPMGRPDAATERILGLEPGGAVRGVFRPGSSKSLAQRCLLAAAVARGETHLQGLALDQDSAAALQLVSDLGVRCETSADGPRIHGRPPGPAALRARGALDVGESGTLARLATALVALASEPGERWTIRARGSLLFRKSPALFRSLERAGARLAQQNLPGTWPVELVAAAPPAELELLRPQSSQEASALLLALAAHPGTRGLRLLGPLPSAPYLVMTERLLARFHAEVQRRRAGEQELLLTVRGPLVAPGESLRLEPDASSAAVVLAAACLSGGEVRVPGLGRDSLQGDVRIVEHLAAFGCDARHEADALSARGFPLRGAQLDLTGEPDLAPVLAVVAAAAARRSGERSRLAGLATLPGKESDRLGGLAALLGALGFEAAAGPDALEIGPGARRVLAGPLDPRADHRMVFACALLGLLEPGVRCRTADAVAKSWSSFWSDLGQLGARVCAG